MDADRGHHSADPSEAKNYAVTLSFLDILFGTFRHRAGPPSRAHRCDGSRGLSGLQRLLDGYGPALPPRLRDEDAQGSLLIRPSGCAARLRLVRFQHLRKFAPQS